MFRAKWHNLQELLPKQRKNKVPITHCLPHPTIALTIAVRLLKIRRPTKHISQQLFMQNLGANRVNYGEWQIENR